MAARREPAGAGASAPDLGPAAPERLLATLVTSDGIFRGADLGMLRELLSRGQFFWIDLVGGDEAARAAWLAAPCFDARDGAWAQRFGQAGRISLDGGRLRASTWLSEGPQKGLCEIHVLSSQACVLTAWDGEASALDVARSRLAEALANPQSGAATATAILLQLILATLHEAMRSVDAQLVALQRQVAEAPLHLDFSAMNVQTRRLQSIWSEVERYSRAVKSALIGQAAASVMDVRGAEEFALYAEQVEDLESRLRVRSQWAAEMLRDYTTAITHVQSEQISRLTVVSLIFLPITFLTGFFGMNFPWMIKALGGAAAFAALGIALPALIVATMALWLARRLAHRRDASRLGRR